MDTSITLNGKTYIFIGGRIYSYRLAFWGKQVYRNVSSTGPLGKKLLAMRAAKQEG